MFAGWWAKINDAMQDQRYIMISDTFRDEMFYDSASDTYFTKDLTYDNLVARFVLLKEVKIDLPNTTDDLNRNEAIKEHKG